MDADVATLLAMLFSLSKILINTILIKTKWYYFSIILSSHNNHTVVLILYDIKTFPHSRRFYCCQNSKAFCAAIFVAVCKP